MAAVLLRQLPGDSPARRLWAGTKLIAVLLTTVVISIHPSWAELGGVCAVLAAGAVAARVPRTAVPRISLWFWAILLLGLLVSWIGQGPGVYTRFTLISLVLMALAVLATWTTSLDELAPAITVLGRPLRLVRIPVDEWALTVALCVRSLPLIVDETRVLIAARRLRPRPRRRAPDLIAAELVDLLTAAMTSAIRRACDMGDAITARGGVSAATARVSRRIGFGRADVLALAVVVTGCALPWALGG